VSEVPAGYAAVKKPARVGDLVMMPQRWVAATTLGAEVFGSPGTVASVDAAGWAMVDFGSWGQFGQPVADLTVVVELPEGVHTAATSCPHCGRHNPHHVHPSGRPPADGDSFMCWQCRGLGLYVVGPLGGVVGVRKPTAVELAELLESAEVREAIATAAESYTPLQAKQLRRGGTS
jgi:hypothetical protein